MRPEDRPFRVTVYASSSERIHADYFAPAERLGWLIADHGFELVWGGGRFGLMGAVSRGARTRGGAMRGVILQMFVDKNVHCPHTREMESVTDMRTRKRGLDENGDAYVVLPGGLGTMEEVLEILSFKQLGFHKKPVVLLNTKGYWDPMLTMLQRGFEQGFIQSHYRGIYTVASTPEEAMDQVVHARTWDPAPWHEGLRDSRGGGTA
jgi:uncharacterized protein (TIGR00730 family)